MKKVFTAYNTKTSATQIYYLGITVFKIFIWGGISLDTGMKRVLRKSTQVSTEY